MAGINKVILVGNLGKDPEVRHLESGSVVANFPLATSEVYTDKNGQKVTQTEWHNVVLWRRNAEVAEKYLSKGRQVLVIGEVEDPSTWTDRDGNQRASLEVTATTIKFIGSRADAEMGGGMQAAPASAPDGGGAQGGGGQGAASDEDIPF